MRRPRILASTFALFVLLACASACSETETGACVSHDEGNSYCFEDREDFACSGTFSSGRSCAAVGYPHYCTSEDMKDSGGTRYAVSRYLDNRDCHPGGAGGGAGAGTGGGGTGQALVEFYADPATYSRAAGYVITEIQADGRSFVPRSSKTGCQEGIVLQGAILPGGHFPKVQFKILGRNYNSLDTAFGAEYTEEVGWANYYVHDLQPGCNTLEVTGPSNNVTLRLNP
jgi:hypothetical protein